MKLTQSILTTFILINILSLILTTKTRTRVRLGGQTPDGLFTNYSKFAEKIFSEDNTNTSSNSNNIRMDSIDNKDTNNLDVNYKDLIEMVVKPENEKAAAYSINSNSNIKNKSASNTAKNTIINSLFNTGKTNSADNIPAYIPSVSSDSHVDVDSRVKKNLRSVGSIGISTGSTYMTKKNEIDMKTSLLKGIISELNN